jgi:hypothetical protein
VNKDYLNLELELEEETSDLDTLCSMRDQRLVELYIHGEYESYEEIFYTEEFEDLSEWGCPL